MYEQFKKCRSLKKKYAHLENDASYYTERVDNKVYIYFEWSNGIVDWLHNFNFPAKPYRHMEDGMWFCHRGFLKVWKTIEPYIQTVLWDPDINEVEIVGYSHGAAIAQLCYEYVRFNRPNIKVTGVGFGSPRVVWGPISKAAKERFKGFKVVRNGRDIVTHLPPIVFGFRHVCDVLTLDSTFGSMGMIDDHRPENYYDALFEYKYLKDPSEIPLCARCGISKDLLSDGWEIREGRCLCPKCVKAYDKYIKEFYYDAR